MFREDYELAADAALSKVSFLKKNPAGYFVMSMLAGMFIGFGVLLAFTAGGLLSPAPYTKVVMGLSFGVALSLVVTAGAELFTGNNFVMTAGLIHKKISFGQALGLWGVCWLGNLAGGMLLGCIYHFTGLSGEAVGMFMASCAEAKMSAGFVPLLCRGVLCNILVCLAVWCGFRCKSESGKLIMVFWCLFAFFTTGFEHSIANMTLFTAALLSPFDFSVSLGGGLYNLAVVTLGNMLGGIVFVALPYALAAREPKAR